MAEIAYSRTFQHVDWIDNQDVVQAGGEKGFNQKFHDLEAELDRISAVVSAIKDGLNNIQQLADGVVTSAKLADNAVIASKLAANAVTSIKLANNAVGTNQIADGAITTAKLQANCIAQANIQNGAVNISKLAFQQVGNGSATVGANGAVVTQLVQKDVPNAKAVVYFPMLTISNTSGTGFAEVEPAIVYRQSVGSTTALDVFIRLTNRGSAQAGVIWIVNTFAT
jgi:hypothetical protein